jgi:hypothetical protein
MRITVILWAVFLSVVSGCGSSTVITSARESYRFSPNLTITGRLALFSMMSAGSSSLNIKSDSLRIADAPYSQPRIVQGTSVNLPAGTSMEGFCNAANDILLEKLRGSKLPLIIIPPQQVQSIINRSKLTIPYLRFLNDYRYVSANVYFLKRLSTLISCQYLLVPQLIVISNVNDNSMSIAWNFGRRSSDYTVIILAHLWDMSTGELIWTGRGTSLTYIGSYERAVPFDALAERASKELIKILPIRR